METPHSFAADRILSLLSKRTFVTVPAAENGYWVPVDFKNVPRSKPPKYETTIDLLEEENRRVRVVIVPPKEKLGEETDVPIKGVVIVMPWSESGSTTEVELKEEKRVSFGVVLLKEKLGEVCHTDVPIKGVVLLKEKLGEVCHTDVPIKGVVLLKEKSGEVGHTDVPIKGLVIIRPWSESRTYKTTKVKLKEETRVLSDVVLSKEKWREVGHTGLPIKGGVEKMPSSESPTYEITIELKKENHVPMIVVPSKESLGKACHKDLLINCAVIDMHPSGSPIYEEQKELVEVIESVEMISVNCGHAGLTGHTRVRPSQESKDAALGELFLTIMPDIAFLQETGRKNVLKKLKVGYHWEEATADYMRVRENCDARIVFSPSKFTDKSCKIPPLFPQEESKERTVRAREGRKDQYLLFLNVARQILLPENEFLSFGLKRIAYALLKERKTGDCRHWILAVSWHGPHNKFKDEKKENAFKGLMIVLDKIRERILSELGKTRNVHLTTVLAGDFNMGIEKAEKSLNFPNYAIPRYKMSSRREGRCIDYFVMKRDVTCKDCSLYSTSHHSVDIRSIPVGDNWKRCFDHDPVEVCISNNFSKF